MLDVSHVDCRNGPIGVLSDEQEIENADDLTVDKVHKQSESLAGHVPIRPLNRQVVDRSQNGVSHGTQLPYRIAAPSERSYSTVASRRRPTQSAPCVRSLRGSVERAFQTKPLQHVPDAVAPDGSDVRVLLQVRGGGLAHIELAPGQTSVAVLHRSVEEIWYFLVGTGEMWRKSGDYEDVVAVSPGVCVTIPVGTAFQFRVIGNEPLSAIGATIPPWPGTGEAVVVSGPWESTVESGPI